MKSKNRQGRRKHRLHYPTSIQLALTIPRFLQKRLEPPRGKDSQSRNKFGCLLAFVDAPSECAWSAPQDRRPLRVGAHTPPASLGAGLRTPACKLAHLPSPRPTDNLANSSLARTPLPSALPSNPKRTAVLQRRCPRRPQTPERPLSTPGASQVAHSSRPPPRSERDRKHTPDSGSRGRNCQEQKRDRWRWRAPRLPLSSVFRATLWYQKKKKKKKKGEGDRREQEGESRRRQAGEREREGARGVSGWTCVCAREGTRGGSGHRQR
ncbi:uncharacterized protein LOC144329907 [Macaca mulatta]